MINVKLQLSETLTPAAQALFEQAHPARLAKIAARLASASFVSHFEGLSSERHRSVMAHDFYLTAARSTQSTAEGTAAVVTVGAPVGLRQRYLGGDINPTKTYKLRRGKTTVTYSALWIPVGTAIGRTGGDYRGQLVVIWNTSTQKGVAIDKTTKDVLFALTGSTITQAADPSVVPTTAALRDHIIPGLAAALRRAAATHQPEE